jgi:predicted ATPase
MPANINALGAELSMAKSLSKALDDLENEGVFDTEYEEIVKILEEVFEMDQVRRALGNLTWSFIDLNLDIVHSSDLTPDQKKEKILQVAGEFADVVASLSTQLADLIAEQENFLEAGEAA